MAAELMLSRPNLTGMGSSVSSFPDYHGFHLGVILGSFLSPAPHTQAMAKFLMCPSPLYFHCHLICDPSYLTTELLVSLFPVH